MRVVAEEPAIGTRSLNLGSPELHRSGIAM